MFNFIFNRFEGFFVDDRNLNSRSFLKVQSWDRNPQSLSKSSSSDAKSYQSPFFRCHGNLLPFTFPIVACVFALVHLNKAEFCWYSPWNSYNMFVRVNEVLDIQVGPWLRYLFICPAIYLSSYHNSKSKNMFCWTFVLAFLCLGKKKTLGFKNLWSQWHEQ